MTTTVAIRTRAGSPTISLDVSYDGLDAPVALFADLELLGWRPPTPAPPPHEAIDWSSPNEATGERFTIRAYRVEDARAQPPRGSGPRDAWTDVERSSHLASLSRLLERHPALELDDEAGLIRVESRRSPAPPPPTPRAAPAPPAPAPAFTPAPGTTAVLITAPLKPSRAPKVEDALAAMGVAAVFDNEQRVVTQRYRGAMYDTTVTELHVGVVVVLDQLDATASLLAGFGLTLAFAEVDEADIAPDAPEVLLGGAEPEPAPTSPVAIAADRNLARVVALADPRARDAVAGVIRSLGLVDASMQASSRMEVSTYRGSRSEREVPALRIEVRIPEPHARLVATHLAEAARLRLDDGDRIWIEAPEVVAEPAPEVAEMPLAPISDAESTAPVSAPATGVGTVSTTGGPTPTGPVAWPMAPVA